MRVAINMIVKVRDLAKLAASVGVASDQFFGRKKDKGKIVQSTAEAIITKGTNPLAMGIEILSTDSFPMESHWDNDPDYPTEDWTDEVINGDTRLGYHHWAAIKREQENAEDS